MEKAEILRRAGAEILSDTEAFCDRAHPTLDDLEAWGKEPVLDVSAGDLFDAEPFYYTSPAGLLPGVEQIELPRVKRQASVSRTLILNASVDVSEVMRIAHAEDPDAWQLAISRVMNRQGTAMSFGALLAATGLSSGELFLGLLLGGWQLSQQEFYGEIICQK